MFTYPTNKNSGLPVFRREFDRLFDDFWGVPALSSGPELPSVWNPSTDIDEEEDHFLLTLDIPGMKREDLRIEVHNDQVLVSGERKAREKRNGYSERRYGRFQRSFTLPTHVDAGRIEAQYTDGVLKVYLPKSEAAKPRSIQIGDGKDGGFLGKKDDAKRIA